MSCQPENMWNNSEFRLELFAPGDLFCGFSLSAIFFLSTVVCRRSWVRSRCQDGCGFEFSLSFAHFVRCWLRTLQRVLAYLNPVWRGFISYHINYLWRSKCVFPRLLDWKMVFTTRSISISDFFNPWDYINKRCGEVESTAVAIWSEVELLTLRNR
jgi:hypothetical protein